MGNRQPTNMEKFIASYAILIVAVALFVMASLLDGLPPEQGWRMPSILIFMIIALIANATYTTHIIIKDTKRNNTQKSTEGEGD